MNFSEGEVYHVFNRGNQQQQIFFNTENYVFFLKKLRKEILPHSDILAYCLMPNHFHLMLYIKPEGSGQTAPSRPTTLGYHPLTRKIGSLQSSYTRAIQKQENFTGSLFQQKTKAVILNSTAQIHICLNYIHQNPMKAGITEKMEGWEFSSFKEYCGFRNGSLCNKTLLLKAIDIHPDENFYEMSYATLSGNDVATVYKSQ